MSIYKIAAYAMRKRAGLRKTAGPYDATSYYMSAGGMPAGMQMDLAQVQDPHTPTQTKAIAAKQQQQQVTQTQGAQNTAPEIPQLSPISAAEMSDRQTQYMMSNPRTFREKNPTAGDYAYDAMTGAIKAGVRHGMPQWINWATGDLPELLLTPISHNLERFDFGYGAGDFVHNLTHKYNPINRVVGFPQEMAERSIQNHPETFAPRTGLQKPVETVAGIGLDAATAYAMPKTVDMIGGNTAKVLNQGSTPGVEAFNAFGVPVTGAQQVDTVLNMANGSKGSTFGH